MAEHDVLFQPLVRLADREAFGYEALARFSDGRSPLAHLFTARQSGVLVDLELSLIESAVSRATRLPEGAMVTLNASVETVLHPRLGDILGSDDSRTWGIELSELSEVTAYESMRRVVAELGAMLLIDDAGSSFSDLDRVSRSSPTIVKVDKAVLHAATDATADVTSLLDYRDAARAAGAHVLAEGVETPDQAQVLQEHGFEFAQGYYFGRPARAEEWLAAG